MSLKKPQLFFIHGGTTFLTQEDYRNYLRTRTITLENYISWSHDYIEHELNQLVAFIRPKMPLKENSNYIDWKIHFERYFDLLEDNIILIGYSLGGIFLAKYLSENKFPKKILAVYLVAPPYDNSLDGEDLVGGFELGTDLSLIESQCSSVNLLFSSTDEIVPASHAQKYSLVLSKSNIVVYDDKINHFFNETFPELVDMIKKDLQIIK